MTIMTHAQSLPYLIRSFARLFAVVVICAGCALASAADALLPDGLTAEPGWVTYIGNGNGAEEAQLLQHESILLHRLTTQAEQVNALRQAVQEFDPENRCTVHHWDPAQPLPYADHMVNKLISSIDIPDAELRRVIAPEPRGQAWVKRDGEWIKLTKPMPEGFAEFPAFLADSGNTGVGKDTQVDVPNSLRFIAGGRLHSGLGATTWRVADGIAVVEYNNPVKPREFRRQGYGHYLEARDAFNGTLLWKHFFPTLRGQIAAAKNKPLILDQGLVLYPVPQRGGKIVAFNLNTGEEVQVYEHSFATSEPQFNVHEGVIYTSSANQVRAIDVATGELKWDITHAEGEGLARPTVAADLGLVVMLEAQRYKTVHNRTPSFNMFGGSRYPKVRTTALVAFTLEDGTRAWRTPINESLKNFTRVEPAVGKKFGKVKNDFHSLSYHQGRLFALYACDANHGNPSVVWAVDARTGADLWTAACGPKSHKTRQMFNLFPLEDGTLVTMGHSWARMDQATGDIVAFGDLAGNPRCDTHSATANLITGGFGNYWKMGEDPGNVQFRRSDITRGPCGGRLTPAYGMTYHMGSGCGCFKMIRGRMALQTRSDDAPQPIEQRLLTGPAVDAPLVAHNADAWADYMGRPDRNAWVAHSGPAELQPLWSVDLGDPLPGNSSGPTRDAVDNSFNNGVLTAPVSAKGLVVVANREQHRVYAVELKTGKVRWSYRSEGRLSSPPTLAQGRVVFGDRMGYVHCLDLQSGELAWRFRAAPSPRVLMAYGRIESPWPLHGSLNVVEGVVTAAAGYHGETDGGIYTYGLSLKTGNVLWQEQMKRGERAWTPGRMEKKRTQAPFPTLSFKDPAGAYSKQNGSNYQQTNPINDSPPVANDGVALIGGQLRDAQTGTKWTGTARPTVAFAERFPHLDMESEDRGGPHGSGGWSTRLNGVRIGLPRGGRSRVIRNEKRVFLVMPTFNNKAEWGPTRTFGMHCYGVDADDMQDRFHPKTAKINFFVPGMHAFDSFIAGGQVAYAAAQGHAGEGERTSARRRKSQAVSGRLVTLDLESGKASPILELESAVINNGLAIAQGRLIASCEDGTLRLFGDGE